MNDASRAGMNKPLGLIPAGLGVLLALVIGAAVFVAATFDPGAYKEKIARAVKERTGRTLTIDGKLSLSVFPKIGVAIGNAALSERGGTRAFARLDAADLSLDVMALLAQRVVIDRISLSGLSVELVRYKDGRSNFGDLVGESDKPASTSPGKTLASDLNIDAAGVSMTDAVIAWRDERDGTRLRLTLAELKTGRIADGARGNLHLDAAIEGPSPRMKLRFQLSSAYRLALANHAVSFRDIDASLVATEPIATKFGLSGIADVDWRGLNVLLALDGKWDESPLHAKIAVKRMSPPDLSGEISLDRLNVDDYTAAQRSGTTGAARPIDLSALTTLTLNGDIRIGQLTVAKMRATDVHLGVRAAGGKLDVNPVSARLYQGTVSGTAAVNAKSGQYALRQQLTAVRIGALLRDVTDSRIIDGKGDISLDLRSSGTSVQSLKTGLAGSAHMKLTDGAIVGLDIADYLSKAKAVLGSKSGAPAQQANSRERTAFSQLTASFTVKNGVAHNDDLSVKSPLLRLGGAGDIDIGAGSINYLAKVSAVATSVGQGGKDLKELTGLTVPIRLSGPLGAPSYHVELGSLPGGNLAQQITRRAGKLLDAAKDAVSEQIGDRLKGLFRK